MLLLGKSHLSYEFLFYTENRKSKIRLNESTVRMNVSYNWTTSGHSVQYDYDSKASLSATAISHLACRRLMGIKSSAGPPPPKATEAAAASASVTEESHSAAGNTEKTAAMFREQEEQYERARAITHTAKGLGLGFSSLGPP